MAPSTVPSCREHCVSSSGGILVPAFPHKPDKDLLCSVSRGTATASHGCSNPEPLTRDAVRCQFPNLAPNCGACSEGIHRIKLIFHSANDKSHDCTVNIKAARGTVHLQDFLAVRETI